MVGEIVGRNLDMGLESKSGIAEGGIGRGERESEGEGERESAKGDVEPCY